MNNRLTLIAVMCGVLTAWLFLGRYMLGGIGLLLSTFTALPIFVSVLGFGTVAGLISGGVAAVIIALVHSLPAAALVFVFTMGPALWIGHMAGLSRNDAGQDEWFPLSTIIMRMAIMCAGISIIAGFANGFTVDGAAAMFNQMLTTSVDAHSKAAQIPAYMSEAEIAGFSTMFAKLVPIILPGSLFFGMVLNVLLAERFTRKRGWMLRPKEHLPTAIAMPPVGVAVFIAAVVASFAGGGFGLIAQTIAGSFGAAFMAVGLATLHLFSRKWPARGVILTFTYIAIPASRIMAPVIAVIGVAETLFQLRSRAAAGSPPT